MQEGIRKAIRRLYVLTQAGGLFMGMYIASAIISWRVPSGAFPFLPLKLPCVILGFLFLALAHRQYLGLVRTQSGG